VNGEGSAVRSFSDIGIKMKIKWSKREKFPKSKKKGKDCQFLNLNITFQTVEVQGNGLSYISIK